MIRMMKRTVSKCDRQALKFFQEAHGISPRSGSANRAIANVTGYIARGSRKRIGIAGKPGRVGSAATRGNCFQNQKPAIPLLAPGLQAVLTTEEYPTFYFYIPQITPETQAMEFVLRDDLRDDENITPENIRPFKLYNILACKKRIFLQVHQTKLKRERWKTSSWFLKASTLDISESGLSISVTNL